ncbi:MAG: zinc finger Ran-binding domain-containing protein [Bacteroidota bacterium]
MICNHCNTENEAHASYCIKCGYNLQSLESGTMEKSKFSDIIVIMIVFFMMFSKFVWTVFSLIHTLDWHSIRYFSNFLNLIWGAVPLLLAFTVKNKVWKIILIVIGGIYALMSVIEIVRELMMQPAVNFNF